MCLGGGGGGGGPVVTEAQNKAAAQARLDSEAAARQQAKKVADAKREDIDEALDTASSAESRGKSGKGRRSLFSSSSGGSGYLSRFG